MSTDKILGFDISSLGRQGDVDKVWSIIEKGEYGKYVSCINPHSTVVSTGDSEFVDSLKSSDILVPDGAGIVLASNILGKNIKERVTGADIFFGISEYANKKGGVKYFFLGSTQAVLDKISANLAKDYPGIEICGTYSPPYKPKFSDEDNAVMIDLVNQVKPDVLWVGMTAPKQEKWIHENKDKLQVPLSGAIGAVFDFYAGTVPRSPEWACRMGLEWLPRLAREPRRLFKRNFISSPLFLLMVFKEKLGFTKG